MKGKIFNAQEVQAILAGNKTMFREVINTKQSFIEPSEPYGKFPYQVRQKIFCKESFLQKLGSTQLPSGEHETFFTSSEVEYVANGAQERFVNPNAFISDYWKKRPAQHMKQKHSRLTLQIKEIRVERLHEISEKDAIAEGAEKIGYDADYGTFHRSPCGDYRTGFIVNWNATHKKPEEKWKANPWVWCVSFEVIK
ncbi:MAG: hypothetical protein EBS06_05535 [Proteobacteria bacterium]|nr:hypothetical protein [Pseudomonadota bacterium]